MCSQVKHRPRDASRPKSPTRCSTPPSRVPTVAPAKIACQVTLGAAGGGHSQIGEGERLAGWARASTAVTISEAGA